jgi:hypothetical protein
MPTSHHQTRNIPLKQLRQPDPSLVVIQGMQISHLRMTQRLQTTRRKVAEKTRQGQARPIHRRLVNLPAQSRLARHQIKVQTRSAGF